MKPYIIAEIGQNHNGNLDKAKEMIKRSALCGANAVKFTKRDLESEFTQKALNRQYTNKNSFGFTYGEHRYALELNRFQLGRLQKYAHSLGIDFILTVCDFKSLYTVGHLGDKIKIASRDITNIPLIEEALEFCKNKKKELIISTGLAVEEDLYILKKLIEFKEYVWLLNCTSQYPTAINNIHHRRIEMLSKFNLHVEKIGHSDHTGTIWSPLLAYTIGAKMIEVHVTLDRHMKGTDHVCSLEFHELFTLCNYIEKMYITQQWGTFRVREEMPEYLVPARNKLMKFIVAKRDIMIGQVITEKDIILKCVIPRNAANALKWSERSKILGKKNKIMVIYKDQEIKELMVN